MLSFAVCIAFFVLNAVLQTASRLTWAFARDNAIIFSGALSKVHPTLDVPLNAIILDAALIAVCGCIFLASSTGESNSPQQLMILC